MKPKCEFCGDSAFKAIHAEGCGLVTMCQGCYDSYMLFLAKNYGYEICSTWQEALREGE